MAGNIRNGVNIFGVVGNFVGWVDSSVNVASLGVPIGTFGAKEVGSYTSGNGVVWLVCGEQVTSRLSGYAPSSGKNWSYPITNQLLARIIKQGRFNKMTITLNYTMISISSGKYIYPRYYAEAGSSTPSARWDWGLGSGEGTWWYKWNWVHDATTVFTIDNLIERVKSKDAVYFSAMLSSNGAHLYWFTGWSFILSR